jgi:hypothetical protein
MQELIAPRRTVEGISNHLIGMATFIKGILRIVELSFGKSSILFFQTLPAEKADLYFWVKPTFQNAWPC